MISLPHNIICGYFDCANFEKIKVSPKRTATKFEIELYTEDGLKTMVNDNEYCVRKGYVLITKPGQVRYSKLPFKTAYIKFNADSDIAEKLSSAPEYFLCSHSKKIMEHIDDIILLKNQDKQLLLYSRLLSLINLILYDSEIADTNDYNIISKTKRFIENNYAQKITLSDIAANVNLSNVYFHNIFTKATGVTPHQYLTDFRIENAKKLLWNLDLSLQSIAYECGFCNQQHFTKVFKSVSGMTPVAYRKLLGQDYLS